MTAPERYRKKPVVIDAIQWTGDNLRAVIGFTDGPPDTRSSHAGMMWKKYEDLVQREGLKIYTLEGTMKADVGDYIIKGVKGEFYPCKPDIFSATYDRADLAAVQPAQVQVKPLVWEERDAHFHAAQSQIGVYYLTDYKGMVVPFKLECPSQISSRNYTSIDDAKAAAQVDYEASILAALEPQPDQTVEIDLRVAMMEELEKAASESLWVPEEYYMNEVISDCCAFLRSDRSQPDPRDEHFDDYAVRSFAKMMAAKMAASRAKGRGGWSDPAQCSVEYLRQLLYAHLDKGDPVDVANICMMLRHYEASTAHEYESSAMAAACVSRDKVIARMVEALTNLRDLMCESFEDDDGNLGCGQCENDCTGCIAHAALAAAKAVQHG